MKKVGLIALTEKGFLLGEKISAEYSNVDLLTIKSRENWLVNGESLSALVKESFEKYDGLIFIMALGIVVRMIKDYIKSKDLDPAIIVIDEQGKNTISVLSGHLGGGNKLTEELSKFLNNNPVITTATDVNNIYALDSFATDHDLEIEPVNNIKKFNSALLKGENIQLIFDDGLDFPEKNSYKNFFSASSLRGMITNKRDTANVAEIFLRPKNIILGVGCKKNFPKDKFEKNILNIMEEKNISLKSVKEIRSIDIKKDENCIVDFSSKYKIPFYTLAPDKLNSVYNKHNNLKKSDFVYKNTGAWGVAEPSALFSESENLYLILARKEIDGMTIAVSEERPFIIENKNFKWLKRKEEK
ncbi:MAG: cobalt-precorrin 5A hydrolase [Eubacteriales bacterium]|nr:cobalt-precorrin 5A hydrolase [Eubacteriales bacterium]